MTKFKDFSEIRFLWINCQFPFLLLNCPGLLFNFLAWTIHPQNYSTKTYLHLGLVGRWAGGCLGGGDGDGDGGGGDMGMLGA